MEEIFERVEKPIKAEEEAILAESSSTDALQNGQNENGETLVADQSEVEVFKEDPISSAFSNTLILEKILKELNYDNLLSSRLVAQSWKEMALTIFSKTSSTKFQLPLNKLFKSPEYDSMPMSKFMANLAKCVHFSQDCTCGKICALGGPACVTTITKFIEFVNKFSNHIEIMDFYISASFLSILRTLSNKCPNLKVLSFKSEARYAPEGRFISFEKSPVPEQPFYRMGLHTIEVFHDVYSGASNFRWMLQHVINGAPNLKRLKIWDNFYPDLSNNNKLVYLSHTSRSKMYNFNRAALSGILHQVKDSLEVLELSTSSGPGSRDVQQQHFAFSVMPKLKTLTLDVSMYSLGEDGLDAIETLFPNLENLEITSSGTDTVEDVLSRTTLFQHESLRTLMLNKIESPAVLSFFKLWFPNLTKMELSMCLAADGISEDSSIESLFLAMSMGELELKHFILRIDSKFRFLFSTLVRQLDANPELFEEMEILEIYTRETFDWSLAKDDLRSAFENRGGDKYESMKIVFCDWLENKAKNMKSVLFHGFTFTGATAWEVMSLIREKKLPVKFVNAEY